jgi:hypothetical protein
MRPSTSYGSPSFLTTVVIYRYTGQQDVRILGILAGIKNHPLSCQEFYDNAFYRGMHPGTLRLPRLYRCWQMRQGYVFENPYHFIRFDDTFQSRFTHTQAAYILTGSQDLDWIHSLASILGQFQGFISFFLSCDAVNFPQFFCLGGLQWGAFFMINRPQVTLEAAFLSANLNGIHRSCCNDSLSFLLLHWQLQLQQHLRLVVLTSQISPRHFLSPFLSLQLLSYPTLFIYLKTSLTWFINATKNAS